MKTENFIVEKAKTCPDEHKPGVLYLAIDDDGKPYYSEALCPCGCSELFNLSHIETFGWAITVDDKGRPDISPSILRTTGCRSHFFIKKGRVQWT